MENTDGFEFHRSVLGAGSIAGSLIPRPREEEEKKGPGFSRSRMR